MIDSAYISGALTGLPREEADAMKQIYELLASLCGEAGVNAYVPHLHSDPEKHADMPAKDVYDVDTREVISRKLLIAEVTHPSHGVGGEVVHAQLNNIPIWLVYRKGTRVSRYLRGNPGIRNLIEYETERDLRFTFKKTLMREGTPLGRRFEHSSKR